MFADTFSPTTIISRRPAWGLVAASLLLCNCAILHDRPWHGTDEFVGELRCGMKEADIAAHVAKHRAATFAPTNDPDKFVAQKGNTLISLWLEDGGLRAHKVTWSRPIAKHRSHLKHDLCSGELFVELHLIGSPELKGAVVALDGVPQGRLSRSGTLSLDVPLGDHEVSVERAGDKRLSFDVSYTPTSPGHHQIKVEPRAL